MRTIFQNLTDSQVRKLKEIARRKRVSFKTVLYEAFRRGIELLNKETRNV